MDKILQVFSSSNWRTGTYRAGPLLTPELNIGPSMQALNPPSEWTKSCKFRTPPRDSANIDVGGYGGNISSLDSFDDISRIKMLSVRTCKILSISRMPSWDSLVKTITLCDPELAQMIKISFQIVLFRF